MNLFSKNFIIIQLKRYYMFKNIIYSACLILTLFYFYACQKSDIIKPQVNEIEMPGTSGGTARYALASTKNTCINSNAAGNYSKGTALNELNTILVSVAIDSIGTYTIATANINGILFKASGIFTNTGLQTIALQGYGTPLSAGSFNFIPGVDGCSFPVKFTSGGALNNDAIFALNGAPDSCIAPIIMGNYNKNIALNYADSIVLKVNVGKPGLYSISTSSINGMMFCNSGTFTHNGFTTITLFALGTPYSSGTFNFISGTNGCFFTIVVK